VMETAAKASPILAAMAESGNPASISDVGVGLLALRSCIEGAAMNVRINLAGLKDDKLKSVLQERVREIRADSDSEFKKIEQLVEAKLAE
jgi:glutamate formiminotransferase / formiminotetrahydrofolate cyclodeaminase